MNIFFKFTLPLFRMMCSNTLAVRTFSVKSGLYAKGWCIFSVFNFQSKLFPTNDYAGELTGFYRARRKLYFEILVADSLVGYGKKMYLSPVFWSCVFMFSLLKMCYLMANLHNWNAEHHKNRAWRWVSRARMCTRWLMRDKITGVTVSKLEKK